MKHQLISMLLCMSTICGIFIPSFAQDVVDDKETDVREVDLGLSVNWAAWNIGAETPDEFGTYFPWGETAELESYELSQCRTFAKDWEWLGKKGYIQWRKTRSGDEEGVISPEHDAAQVIWGDGWRMPSVKEFRELQSNCQIEPYNVNGVDGWLYISKVPGFTDKSIFFPATGYMGASEEDKNEGYPTNEIIDSPETAYFWTRDYFPTDDVTGRDWRMSGNGTGEWLDEYRFYGFPIRPVKSKK